MKPESQPPLEDVLDAYALEPQNDKATLERYLSSYPQYAAELVDLSRELERPSDLSTAPLDAKDRSLIDEAWKRFTSVKPSVDPSPLLALDPAKTRTIATALGLPRQILAAFREGRVIAETVPRHFVERLAAALGTPYEVLRTSLPRAPTLGPQFALGRSYKADDKPEPAKQVSFEQLLVDACVPPEKRAALLAELD